jgi:hypothetical protein
LCTRAFHNAFEGNSDYYFEGGFSECREMEKAAWVELL